MNAAVEERPAEAIPLKRNPNGGITACIASIPPRGGVNPNGLIRPGDGGAGSLQRTLMGVLSQMLLPAAIDVQVDLAKTGVWAVRNRLIDATTTDWLAFCDDDDWWYPEHLALLAGCAAEQRADYVFSWFDSNMSDPLGNFGRIFDRNHPHHTTMNILVRTELARQVRFTPPDPGDTVAGEDWRFILGCVDAGARIVHLPQRTWFWNFHGTPAMGGPNPNTSGQPRNW